MSANQTAIHSISSSASGTGKVWPRCHFPWASPNTGPSSWVACTWWSTPRPSPRPNTFLERDATLQGTLSMTLNIFSGVVERVTIDVVHSVDTTQKGMPQVAIERRKRSPGHMASQGFPAMHISTQLWCLKKACAVRRSAWFRCVSSF